MAADGVRRAIGLVLAAHRWCSSCTQYRQNVVDARAEIVAAGLRDVPVIYTGDWHMHPKFIEANAEHVRRAAIEQLPEGLQPGAQVVFTAHSVPSSMSGAAALSHADCRIGPAGRRCGGLARVGGCVSEPQRTSRGPLAWS